MGRPMSPRPMKPITGDTRGSIRVDARPVSQSAASGVETDGDRRRSGAPWSVEKPKGMWQLARGAESLHRSFAL
jgi:hypothetical protein